MEKWEKEKSLHEKIGKLIFCLKRILQKIIFKELLKAVFTFPFELFIVFCVVRCVSPN